ncbi:hypothetical protein [Streptomyces sp. NPDC056628]|uniref:hypothetical protein n=1 Tax=Streptomyces sp. NPDC056628 TaxID=3345882 RepID=UPI00367F58B9
MSAEHDGADALMTAITGESLPPGARADAAFLAEHRAAEADLAVLREQLGVIGRALAGPPPAAPEPVGSVRPAHSPSRPRRRAFSLALGGLAVTAAASVMAGLGWLVAGGPGDGDGASASADAGSAAQKQSDEAAAPAFGSPRYLACSRLVAEAEATAVERLTGTTTVRITLRLTRTYHPDEDAPGKRPDEEQVFVVDENVVPGVRAGDPVLVGVPRDARQPDFWAVGERDIAPERAAITAALPEARELACG